MFSPQIANVHQQTLSSNNCTKKDMIPFIKLSILVTYFQNVIKGTRHQNSYMLHQNRAYHNPYPLNKKLQPFISQRPNISLNYTPQHKNLKFSSNFQSGNLDTAIYVNQIQYDLFMKVDTNTKGHTNWYYFSVQNLNFMGVVTFNICNFRRQKSLYQRGMKPYCNSKRSTNKQWKQCGQKITYQKRPLRYKFLYDQDYDYINILKTYFTLSFTYNFDKQNDTVQFAYFIPYTYTKLYCYPDTNDNSNSTTNPVKYQPKNITALKSLSGLSIPILEITDNQIPEHNKKVIVVTGRIHPGQANSSFVAQGFIQEICSSQQMSLQFRKNFITYIIPMLNPDGVVAGNYRTSLFGKDLNRTYNQTRKFAFPQTFHLLQFIRNLKQKHKQRFSIFLDLHGHSVKKNIFMYGPQYNIQQNNSLYYLSKQLPRILTDLTSFFRYYSCIFKISPQKAKTARAILNKQIGITFTYTVECSNSAYYDRQTKKQHQFNSKKLKKMGSYLAEGLNIFSKSLFSQTVSSYTNRNNNNYSQRIKYKKTSSIDQNVNQQIQQNNYQQNNDNLDNNYISIKNISQEIDYEQQKNSDDKISQGKSDSQPQDEDLSDKDLQKILATLQQNNQTPQTQQYTLNMIPQNNQKLFLQNQQFKLTKFSQSQKQIDSHNINNTKTKNQKFIQRSNLNKRYLKKCNIFLPPINCLNRVQQRGNITNTNLNTQKIYLQPLTFFPQSNINIATNNIMIISPSKKKQTKSHRKLALSQILDDIQLNNQCNHYSQNNQYNHLNQIKNPSISPGKVKNQSTKKQIKEQIKQRNYHPINHVNNNNNNNKVYNSVNNHLNNNLDNQFDNHFNNNNNLNNNVNNNINEYKNNKNLKKRISKVQLSMKK